MALSLVRFDSITIIFDQFECGGPSEVCNVFKVIKDVCTKPFETLSLI